MIRYGISVLTEAAQQRQAVAGMVGYNLETVQGIVGAAEETGLPVLLQIGSSAFRHAGRGPLVALARAVAKESPAAIGLHLDHSRDVTEIAYCIDQGYSSVMVDGSHLPFDDNVELTREAAELAHSAGVWVEGELAAIGGLEDLSVSSGPGTLTNPLLAGRFVEATGVDALAVSVGNVHGVSSGPITLDVERVAAIHDATGIPLVLHGASGLPPQVVAACLSAGVAKLNFNTELRQSYLVALMEALPVALDAVDLVGPLAAGRAAVTATAARLMRLLAEKDLPSEAEAR